MSSKRRANQNRRRWSRPLPIVRQCAGRLKHESVFFTAVYGDLSVSFFDVPLSFSGSSRYIPVNVVITVQFFADRTGARSTGDETHFRNLEHTPRRRRRRRRSYVRAAASSYLLSVIVLSPQHLLSGTRRRGTDEK